MMLPFQKGEIRVRADTPLRAREVKVGEVTGAPMS